MTNNKKKQNGQHERIINQDIHESTSLDNEVLT
jgi:hypothetical protein